VALNSTRICGGDGLAVEEGDMGLDANIDAGDVDVGWLVG
jgi:hypothetical protein